MRHKTESGFTLLELMIVTIILLIIFSAVFSSIINAQKSFDAEQANAEANANVRFAMNRVKEVLQGSGNNPLQVTNINDQTGGIISLYSDLGNPAFTTTGLTGTRVPSSGPALTGTSNCTPAEDNTYCGVAIDLQSDLNGNGITTDDINTVIGTTIFNQNIITSEHVELYLDRTIDGTLPRDEIMLINMNGRDGSGNPIVTQTAIAESIVDLRFKVSIPDNAVTISITARSNRAVAIENVVEKRFRYATLISRVRIRNMNANVASLEEPYRFKFRGLLGAYL